MPVQQALGEANDVDDFFTNHLRLRLAYGKVPERTSTTGISDLQPERE